MSSPNVKASTFAAHFRAFGAEATDASSFQPYLDLSLKTATNENRTLASALSEEEDVCALLALSQGSVGLGHHFFYDAASPLHPKRSNNLFVLQGRQRFPNPSVFFLDDILAGPTTRYGIKVPNSAAFMEVKTADDITNLTVASRSVNLKARPIMTIPPFLMGVLMREESPDPSDLCMAVIRFCRDFNAQRNRGASDTMTVAAATTTSDASPSDEDEDDGDKKLAASIQNIGKKLISQDDTDEDWEKTETDTDGNVIDAPTMSLAQRVLLPVMQWLWAVKHGSITPTGGINMTIPPRVEQWVESVVSRCLVTGTPPEANNGNGDLVAAVQALTAATTVALQQQTTRNSSDKTSEKDDDVETPKMTDQDRRLLLWASEMVEQPNRMNLVSSPSAHLPNQPSHFERSSRIQL